MNRFLTFLTLLLALQLGACERSPAPSQDTPDGLVSRDDLFDPQERIRMRISPDGTMIAWLEGREGAYQVLAAKRDDLANPRALTPADLAVSNFFFAPNGTHIAFVANYRSYSVAIGTGEVSPIEFDVPEALVTPVTFSVDHPDETILIAFNRQWKRVAVARANVVTGKATALNIPLEDINGLLFDRALSLRAGIRYRPDGSAEILSFRDNRWQPVTVIPEDQASRFTAVGFDGANDRVFVLDGRDLNETGVKLLDLDTGETELVAGISTAPITDALINPLTGELDAMLIGGDRNEWLALTPIGFSAFDIIREADLGRVRVLSRSLDDRYWIVITMSASRPNRYFLIDIEDGTTSPLLDLWPALADLPASQVTQLLVDVGGATPLRGALFLPSETPVGENGLPVSPLPTVVSLERYDWFTSDHDFEPIIPWLNSRGYAFLAIAPRLEALADPDASRSQARALGEWLISEGIAPEEGAIIAGDGWRGTLVLDLMSESSGPYLAGVAISPSFDASNGQLAPIPEQLEGPVLIGLDDFTDDGNRERALDIANRSSSKPLLVLQNDEIADSIVNNKAFLAAFEVFGHDLTGARMEPVSTLKGRESVTVLVGSDYFTASGIDIEE